MKENETFKLKKPVEAITIAEHAVVILPAGTIVTVQLIFGDPISPTAYEVEAFLPESSSYALATVESVDVL